MALEQHTRDAGASAELAAPSTSRESSARGPAFTRHFTMQDARPPQLEEVDLTEVHPSLRTLLFTDGTVTRTLEAQALLPVSVEVLAQDRTVVSDAHAELLGVSAGTGAVRRRVGIGVGESASPAIWAESHILPSRLPGGFLDVLDGASDGIGESLQRVQLENWRELLWFGFGDLPEWSGERAPTDRAAITRVYRVIARGQPSLLISETFTVRRSKGTYRLHPSEIR